MRGRARGRQGNKAAGEPARAPGQDGATAQPGQPQLGSGRQPGPSQPATGWQPLQRDRGPQPGPPQLGGGRQPGPPQLGSGRQPGPPQLGGGRQPGPPELGGGRQPGPPQPATGWQPPQDRGQQRGPAQLERGGQPQGGERPAPIPPLEGAVGGATGPGGPTAPYPALPGSGRASYRGASSAQRARGPEELDLHSSLRRAGLPQGAGVERELLSGLAAMGLQTQGSDGKQMDCRGNFFRLTCHPTFHIYQYHVDFQPPVENKKMKKTLLYDHKELLGDVCVFDGMILYLTKRLPDEKTVVHARLLRQEINVQISIKFTCQITSYSPMMITIMNIIWKKILYMMGLKEIGQHFFYLDQAIDIRKHGLQVIPGLQTSILRYQGGVMLELDIIHKILRTRTVLDLIMEQRGLHPQELLVWMKKNIVGTTVLTTYNNKTYRVDDIDIDTAVTDTFEWRNTQRTYKDYFQQIHNVTIRHDRQPLLVHTCNARERRSGLPQLIHLIPELCVVTGLTEEARKNNFLMKDLAIHTRVSPATRIHKLRQFMDAVKTHENVQKELTNWQVGFEDDLVQIKARQAVEETLLMAGRTEIRYRQDKADWSMEMRGQRLSLAVNLDNWVILCPASCVEVTTHLISTLAKVGPPMGMNIRDPRKLKLENDRNDTYLNSLRTNINQGVQMVVCVLPNARKDRYDAIKKLCCIDIPVPSQMVLSQKLSKPNMLMSIATKIAIQMNCKMGGVPYSVKVPLKGAMIVGIDTYHDSSMKGRSCAAVVCTTNDDWTRYHSSTSFQMSHEELHNHLHVSMTASLRAYFHKNGCHPKKVIVFRDGVGDGQLDMVNEHEVRQIQNAINQCNPEGGSKLAFIVVKKRINSRFFLGENNPPPGTIVDSTVTRDYWYDFFLISQSVRQGTVGPTHYNIVHQDEGMNLKPDHYQRLAYKLTHLYYNWQGTIKVPAPCMYAHKLAFLSGQSLHRGFSHHLADKLFFL